jgi:hypothetical protein
MTDFNTPTNSSLYTAVLTALNGKISSCAKMDFSSDTNIPTGTVRYDSTNKILDSWNGSSWVNALPTAVTSFTPTYTAVGGMTFTSTSLSYANYIRMGKLCFFHIVDTGTTSGSASNEIEFASPLTQVSQQVLTAWYADGGSAAPGACISSSTTKFRVRKADGSNFALSTGRIIWVSGFFITA